MARIVYGDRPVERLTVDMPPELRTQLDQMATDRGWSLGQCVRRIIAEHFARLQQEEATP